MGEADLTGFWSIVKDSRPVVVRRRYDDYTWEIAWADEGGAGYGYWHPLLKTTMLSYIYKINRCEALQRGLDEGLLQR